MKIIYCHHAERAVDPRKSRSQEDDITDNGFKDAQLVGATSFGKGIMQVTTALEDGGGLTLTVATYQTTRSDCYHGVGLEPDVPVEAAPETEITAIDPDTDPQLAKAIEVLR